MGFRTGMSTMLAIVGAVVLIGAAAYADDLNGAGATFPQPLYQKWFQEYKDAKGVAINYQGIGSGGGIKLITAKAVDFGASDAPMSNAELAAPGAADIIHIPTVAGAVCISYNVPGVGPGIHLTGDVVADIFLGKIRSWDDPRITALNPGTKFPSMQITACHRSDSSGTTNIFTTYLSEVSNDWKDGPGVGKSVKWPTGYGGSKNAGVAELIRQNQGGIGYIELAYAVTNNIYYAAIRNSKGTWVYPDVAAATVAAEGSKLPPDFRKVITNTASEKGYPITGFTFILVHRNGTKPEVKEFLKWALTTGEGDAAGMYYAPLPDNVRKRALEAVESIQ